MNVFHAVITGMGMLICYWSGYNPLAYFLGAVAGHLIWWLLVTRKESKK